MSESIATIVNNDGSAASIVVFEDVEGTPPDYFNNLQAFDYDNDRLIRMYRKMSPVEAKAVMDKKGLVFRPTDSGLPEKWLTSSLRHTRVFENDGVQDNQNDVVVAFTVNLDTFGKEFASDSLIHQFGSRKVNEGRPVSELKNLVNREQLRKHPKRKFNICLKGEKNIERFNKTIEKVENFNLENKSGVVKVRLVGQT